MSVCALAYFWVCLFLGLPVSLSVYTSASLCPRMYLILSTCLTVRTDDYVAVQLFVCMFFLSMFVCVKLCLPVCVSVCPSLSISICPNLILRMFLPQSLSISVCLSVCMSQSASVYLLEKSPKNSPRFNLSLSIVVASPPISSDDTPSNRKHISAKRHRTTYPQTIPTHPRECARGDRRYQRGVFVPSLRLSGRP